MESQGKHSTPRTASREDLRKPKSHESTREMTKRRFHIFLNRQGFKEKILDDATIKKYDRLRNRRKYNRRRDPWW